MSTRGLWGIRKNGADKLTYNHCDSYPSWLGVKIVLFISDLTETDLNKLFDSLELVEEDSKPTKEQKVLCKKFGLYNNIVGTRSDDDWYCLLREAQGNFSLYEAIAKESDSKKCRMPFINSNDFIKDSLFCEWAYIINLDTGNLEIWKGFQKKPHKSNRYGITHDSSGYYPCWIVKRIKLDDIRNDKEKYVEFMRHMEDEDE